MEEGYVVCALGIIGEASVSESGYLFRASVYPVGGVITGAQVVAFLHLTCYGVYDIIDCLGKF